jgi:hypothetical protein
MTPTPTAQVIDRFNQAFRLHQSDLLVDLVDENCVMESVEPAPNGTRYEGGETCLSFWQALANDSSSAFETEDVVVIDDHAIIRWRYRFGAGDENSVRGVNLMHVVDGKIVEALGYVKSGEAAVAGAINQATTS